MIRPPYLTIKPRSAIIFVHAESWGTVIPAKAGIQGSASNMDSRLRGNDDGAGMTVGRE